MPNTIHLKVGEIVSYKGENWKIFHVEDLERVLATRISDQRHEYLLIAGLAAPVWPQLPQVDTEASATQVEKASTQLADPPMVQRLKDRQLREPPPAEGNDSSKQSKDYFKAVEEFQFVQRIIKSNRQERPILIQEMCKTFGFSRATAYLRIRIVKISGDAAALMRAVRADKGKYKIPKEVREVALKNLIKHRFIAEPKSLFDILDFVKGDCKSKGLAPISLATLRNIEQETSLKKQLESQGRKKKVKDLFGSKVGELPDKDYPLETVQVDHTPIQVCLVDEVERQPIGDAWLSLAIDCYSRMVLGFFLTFDAPSTLSAGMTLAHAFLPKEDFLRSMGVEGKWPCWGFPDIILVDNAAELNGRMMHGARRRYRFDLRNRPVGSANFGGHVESAFKTFMYEFKGLPGTKFSNPIERGEYDSEGRAILTISEFERLFTEFLVNDYHLAEHSGKGMNKAPPLIKWNQGIFEGDIMPPTGLPERPAYPLELRISLLPIEMRTITKGTVRIFELDYFNPALKLIGDSINLNKQISERQFEVRYDPRDISKIWLLNPDTNDYLELVFTDLRKGSISLWEHNAIKRRRGNPSEQYLDQRYESKQKRENIKETAAKKTKQQRLADEKERRRAQSALIQPPPVSKRPTSTPSAKQPLDPDRMKALRNKVRPAAVKQSARGGKPSDEA